MTVLDRFWNWIDDRCVVRRLVLLVTLWMTWECYQWAAEFAQTTDRTGMDIAAIIGAVTAPISLLQGAVFKVYSEGRKA